MMLTAGVIEFFGGLMIALGLQTGYAAFLSSGLMAVAYCFLFLYMASRGSGPYSLDRAFRRSS